MATQWTAGLTDNTPLPASTLNQIGAVWETWTPTITQTGNVTFTNTLSRYSRIQKTVIGTTYLTVTGSGTAASAVIVSLPLTAQSGAGQIVGYGFFYDTSAVTLYTVVASIESTTSVRFYTSPNGTGGPWGSNPNVGLAVGDQIRFTFVYEAA